MTFLDKMNSRLLHIERYVLHKTFRFLNVILTFKVHFKINSHCVGRFKLRKPSEMQYFNLDVILIATNEY